MNGYANMYWGWGLEDDDAERRVMEHLKKGIARYPVEIARYKMILTHGHLSAPANPARFDLFNSNYDYRLDGLNTIKYHHHATEFHRLFTLMNVSLVKESIGAIYARLKVPMSKLTYLRSRMEKQNKRRGDRI